MPLTLASPTVAQVVKTETAVLHQEVEQLLIPRLSAIQSLKDYAAILQSFYTFYLPIEKAIQQQISSSLLLDIEKRRTANLIADDLAFLGVPVSKQYCDHLPEIKSIAQAFGAMYVLEGSTLGGKMIAKMLARNSAYSISSGALNFFQGYKEATGMMWTAFVNVLNQQTDTDTIVHAANETFYHLKSWLQKDVAYESKN